MIEVICNLGGSRFRYETLHGRKYLVAPIAFLAEGVWPGSAGPVFYPDRELARSATLWNHMPLVVCPHPLHPKGTAASKKVLEENHVGFILDAKHDTKSRGEAWLDVERLQKISPESLAKLEKNEVVDVSTGMAAKLRREQGQYKGSKYDYVISDIYPDHISVLPNTKGAYSSADGGGLLVTNVEDDKTILLNVYFPSDSEKEEEVKENPKVKEPEPEKEEVHNMGFDRKSHINSLIGHGYEEKDRTTLEKFSDEHLQLIKPVVQNARVETPEIQVPDGFELKTVNNKLTIVKKEQPPAPAPNPPPVQGQTLSWTDVLNSAPPEYREFIDVGMQAFASERDRLIQTLLGNARNSFSKEELEAMGNRKGGLEHLQKMVALTEQQSTEPQNQPAWPVVNYRGAVGASPAHNAVQDMFLDMPEIEWKKN